jgi:hypothetical protein
MAVENWPVGCFFCKLLSMISCAGLRWTDIVDKSVAWIKEQEEFRKRRCSALRTIYT